AYVYVGNNPVNDRDPSGLCGGGWWGLPSGKYDCGPFAEVPCVDTWSPACESPSSGAGDAAGRAYGPSTSWSVNWTDQNGSHSVTMRVYHGDFPGNANDDMVFAAAQAVDAAGYSEFGVSAFSSGGHSCGCRA